MREGVRVHQAPVQPLQAGAPGPAGDLSAGTCPARAYPHPARETEQHGGEGGHVPVWTTRMQSHL